jgi:hypothetical protein
MALSSGLLGIPREFITPWLNGFEIPWVSAWQQPLLRILKQKLAQNNSLENAHFQFAPKQGRHICFQIRTLVTHGSPLYRNPNPSPVERSSAIASVLLFQVLILLSLDFVRHNIETWLSVHLAHLGPTDPENGAVRKKKNNKKFKTTNETRT